MTVRPKAAQIPSRSDPSPKWTVSVIVGGATLDSQFHRVLAPYGPDTYRLEHAWSDEAGMWFAQLSPTRAGAAPISAAFDGRDLVSITVGKNTWFEVFPVKGPDDLDYIEQLAAAVFAGDIEEIPGDTKVVGAGFARITLAGGRVVAAGAAHLPIPWKWQEHIRHLPYTDDLPGTS